MPGRLPATGAESIRGRGASRRTNFTPRRPQAYPNPLPTAPMHEPKIPCRRGSRPRPAPGSGPGSVLVPGLVPASFQPGPGLALARSRPDSAFIPAWFRPGPYG
jgi:hypothetical protein